MSKKIFVTILLVFLVTLMVLPNAFAEDTVLSTATDEGNQPPALPDGEQPGNGTPPDMPNGTMPDFPGNGTVPPDMPNGTAPGNGTPPDMPNGTVPDTPSTDVTENTILTGINLTKVYGTDENFTITFTDNEGNVIIGQHLTVNLTRTTSGASKNYDVVTDYAGIASLPINLAPGTYAAYTTYTPVEGFNYTNASTFNTITVTELGKTGTVLTANPFVEVVNAGKSFNITLTTSDGTPIAGRHISLNLTRVSSGASKVYDSTTDYLGVASLAINLAKGDYTVTGTYAGEDQYAGSYAATTITIVENTNDNSTNPPEIPNGTQPGNGTAPPDMPNGTAPGNGTAPPDMPNGTAPGNGTAPPDMPGGNTNSTTPDVPSTNTTTGGRLIVNGTTENLSGDESNRLEYLSTSSDENAVIVANGGNLNLNYATITKTGDLSNSNSEDSEFYGTNAGVLVLANSVINITNTNIITNATGANAIFSTNLNSNSNGATAYVSNVAIDTYKDKSRGLDATYGGVIIADNVTINTRGGSCAALATDRGEGTITATNSILNTGVDTTKNIAGSPSIYSTGAITAINCTGTAYQSQIGCIEGKNSITLENCDLTGYAKGNRQSNGEYVDLGGFFIYQSMSGDADVGTATLNATNSKLTIASDSAYASTAPMFHITNTKAIINLNKCTLNFDSGILLDASGQDQWGTTGSNGGEVTFTATNQILTGNIEIDSISTLDLTLKSSTLTGAINPTGTYGTTTVTIEEGSTWTLTGNSYITSLNGSGTINTHGYTLYVNGVAYTA